jgi:hypothetical protein
MRSLLLLTAFLFLVAGTAFCVEKATVEVKGDYVRPYIVAPQNSQSAGRFSRLSRPFIHRRIQGDNTCYTMRSMLVAKHPGSDVTEAVGQRTCTPSSYFQTKQVPQPK